MNFYTDHYYSNIGVPQGDPISPILFNLFISDLPSHLRHTGVLLNGVSVPYIQYADDLCILGESPEDLQRGLNDLANYCRLNHIEINIAKTKVVAFHRGRLPHCEFFLDNQPLEMLNNFNYLGFNFSVQLSFSQHASVITSKARSKCGLLCSTVPLKNLPLSLVLQLFDIFILPTFTYGLSMWLSSCSASALNAVDATYTKFLKRYLQVPTHSHNSITHLLTSTTPLSARLKFMAPNMTGALRFPRELHGYNLSFLAAPASATPPVLDVEQVPTWFWLSRTFHSLPTNSKTRRSLCRELFDSDHFRLCGTTTFHTNPSSTCICTFCGGHAHIYHLRFCDSQ